MGRRAAAPKPGLAQGQQVCEQVLCCSQVLLSTLVSCSSWPWRGTSGWGVEVGAWEAEAAGRTAVGCRKRGWSGSAEQSRMVGFCSHGDVCSAPGLVAEPSWLRQPRESHPPEAWGMLTPERLQGAVGWVPGALQSLRGLDTIPSIPHRRKRTQRRGGFPDVKQLVGGQNSSHVAGY